VGSPAYDVIVVGAGIITVTGSPAAIHALARAASTLTALPLVNVDKRD